MNDEINAIRMENDGLRSALARTENELEAEQRLSEELGEKIDRLRKDLARMEARLLFLTAAPAG
jgi:chromosome segregation ATPase